MVATGSDGSSGHRPPSSPLTDSSRSASSIADPPAEVTDGSTTTTVRHEPISMAVAWRRTRAARPDEIRARQWTTDQATTGDGRRLRAACSAWEAVFPPDQRP
ncbi:hypothetical protein ACLOJK_022305 [Asimina triloba]